VTQSVLTPLIGLCQVQPRFLFWDEGFEPLALAAASPAPTRRSIPAGLAAAGPPPDEDMTFAQVR
jgi:hypothetical protein